jgi:pentatricopeptide repeat protein
VQDAVDWMRGLLPKNPQVDRRQLYAQLAGVQDAGAENGSHREPRGDLPAGWARYSDMKAAGPKNGYAQPTGPTKNGYTQPNGPTSGYAAKAPSPTNGYAQQNRPVTNGYRQQSGPGKNGYPQQAGPKNGYAQHSDSQHRDDVLGYLPSGSHRDPQGDLPAGWARYSEWKTAARERERFQPPGRELPPKGREMPSAWDPERPQQREQSMGYWSDFLPPRGEPIRAPPQEYYTPELIDAQAAAKNYEAALRALCRAEGVLEMKRRIAAPPGPSRPTQAASRVDDWALHTRLHEYDENYAYYEYAMRKRAMAQLDMRYQGMDDHSPLHGAAMYAKGQGKGGKGLAWNGKGGKANHQVWEHPRGKGRPGGRDLDDDDEDGRGDKGGRRRALRVVRCMLQRGETPGRYYFSQALRSCRRGGLWTQALALLDQMKVSGVEVDTTEYANALAACRRARVGSKWECAVRLLHSMEESNVPVDSACLRQVFHSCGAARQWQLAVSLLYHYGSGDTVLDISTYNAAIWACARAKRWKAAVDLVGHLIERGLEPSRGTLGWVKSGQLSGSEAMDDKIMQQIKVRLAQFTDQEDGHDDEDASSAASGDSVAMLG